MAERVASSFLSPTAPSLSGITSRYWPLWAAISVPGVCGLTIDQEGHVKKGKESVGVARQYLASIGKVDNGQVTVFAALNQGDDVAMPACFYQLSGLSIKNEVKRPGFPSLLKCIRVNGNWP